MKDEGGKRFFILHPCFSFRAPVANELFYDSELPKFLNFAFLLLSF